MRIPNKIVVAGLGLLVGLCLALEPLRAQDVLTDPPDLRGGTGSLGASGGESIDPISATLRLAIPLGHLPPGPGGFSGGVNLIYNSNIYDVQTVPVVPGSQVASLLYSPSLHGGGFSYGYKYALWAQPRSPVISTSSFGGQSTCDSFPDWEKADWFKTFLQMPDGSSHALRLVSVLNPDGSASNYATQNTNDAPNTYYSIDFSGTPNRGCYPSASSFQGLLVYATVDGTFIRVEANTATAHWTAYLPNGGQVSGPINYFNGKAVDSDSDTIKDRNNNTLVVYGSCSIGSACQEVIWDQQGRNITIQYASKSGQSWQDSITSPGVHRDLTAFVNWQTFDPGNLTYPCRSNAQGFPTGSCSLQGATSSVVTSVQLPPSTPGGSSLIYKLDYSTSGGQRAWGELHSISRCAGTSTASCTTHSTTKYSYYYDPSSSPRLAAGVSLNPVSSRTLSFTSWADGTVGQAPPDETTSYSVQIPNSFYTYPVIGPSTVTGPDGTQTQFYTTNICPVSPNSRDYCVPVLYKVVNAVGTASEATTELSWLTNSAPAGLPAGIPFNAYVRYRVQTVGAKAKAVSISQDTNGNTTSTSEYDWFAANGLTRTNNMITGIPGSAVRTASMTYNTSTTYWNRTAAATFRSVLTAQAGGATSAYTYDSAGTTANLTGLQQSDAGASISSGWTYLTNGNLHTQAANGITTQISYDTANLYPTAVSVGSRTINHVFDFNSGLQLSQADDNQVQTVFQYDDLGRQTNVEQAGGGLDRVSATAYNDVALTVATTPDVTSSPTVTATAHLDALGRVRYTVDAAGNTVQKAYRYGANVSYELTSNPYVALNDLNTMGWTLTARDALGRVSAVQTYSGSDVPSPWGTANNSPSGSSTVSYNASGCTGPGVSVTDAASHTRTQCVDGLGRLTSAVQPDASTATYTYDLLDNLTTVSVAGQTRRFEYSLGRIAKACNPESVPDGSNGTSAVNCATTPLPSTGVDRYAYDSNGRLYTFTNGRGVSTTFGYDALNRPLTKTYSDGTQQVTYTYDQDLKGALSSVTAGGNGTVYGHDKFGRVISSTQTTGVVTYPAMAYTYTLTDQLKTVTYPSGRTVTYGMDAFGRVTGVTGTLALVGTTSYASNVAYAAAGVPTSMQLGANTETYAWNNRLQQTGVSTGSSGSLLSLNFFPCNNGQVVCPDNNGKIWRQTLSIGGQLKAAQEYTHDSLNRVILAAEKTTSPYSVPTTCTSWDGVWCQQFSYDTAGNRSATGVGLGLTSTWETASFSSSTNRISDTTHWKYDDGGNIVKDYSGETFVYDAENRLVAFCKQDPNGCVNQAAAGRTLYVYDGEGQRVQKTDPTGTTVYVYDAFGNLAAEYATAGAGAGGTSYVTVDQLGSTRLVTGSGGTQRYDYLPFGDDLTSGTWRSTAGGYGLNGIRQKYTGQERDTESTLDYFHARYFSGPQGRFASVDPQNAGASLTDPQSWNGYAYVSNNPMAQTDPDGLGIFGTLGGAFGLFGHLIGNGLDALIFGPDSTKGSGPNLAGTLGGCGGPLGNCGTLGSGPWSEASGLGDVQDPDRFIMALNGRKALADTADFVAGAIDNFSFGATAWFRRLLPGGDPRNQCSGYYTAGEWTETGAEITLTLGSATLKTLAKGASRSVVRAAARRNIARVGIEAADGEVIHHVVPLFGHPGGYSTLFPMGGLPASIHSGAWNLRAVEAGAAHNALHQSMRAAESVATKAVNPGMTGARIVVSASGCR